MTNDTAKLLLSKIMEKRSDWLGLEPLRAFLNAPGNVAQSALNAGQSLFTPTPAQAASNADDTARIAARHSMGENALIKQLAMLGLGVGTGIGGIYAINQTMKPRKKEYL